MLTNYEQIKNDPLKFKAVFFYEVPNQALEFDSNFQFLRRLRNGETIK